MASKYLLLQYDERESSYYIYAIESNVLYYTELFKSGFEPADIDVEDNAADLSDFETNFKAGANKKLESKDSDGTALSRTKITTTGWSFQLHSLEFKTSQLDSVYSKKADGTDIGFANIKCYNAAGTLLTTQESCDTDAVKTVIDWEPTYDYECLGGMLKQLTAPTEDIRVWVIGVPDVPAAYGGSKEFVSSVNLKYMSGDGVTADGRAPKYMTYSATYHTNKLRLVFTHAAGYKHSMQMIFEIFRP